MKDKQIFGAIGACVLAILAIAIVHFTNPDYNEEVAFKMKPIFFGDTRVADEPANSFTFYVATTDCVHFNILPQKKEFKFDDLLSNDNTPLDVNMYLVYQIQKEKRQFCCEIMARVGMRLLLTLISVTRCVNLYLLTLLLT